MFEGEYHLHHGDCIEHMATLPDACMDMSVFSPPFPSVFAYTDLESDIGNSEDLKHEAKLHLSFFYRQLVRIIKPGRVVVVHVSQIGKKKRDGEDGLFDFRGMNIRIAQRAGFIYDFDWLVRKNPQAQAIRTRKWELKFQGLETDRSISRGTLSDYLIKFRVPGDNQVPIRDYKIKVDDDGDNREDVNQFRQQVTRNDWIKWAESCWDDIIETDTLNVDEARGPEDTKHICPLQLEVIRRLVILYSNPGEIVFSPFTGCGSEGYMALGGPSPKTKLFCDPRRFYGCELKDEYYKAALVNLERAISRRPSNQPNLFASLTEADE